MHFCSKCGNMYYIKLDEQESKLLYYCRKCGNEDNDIGRKTIVVSKTTIDSKTIAKDNIINEYTHLDPRIPHLHNMLCINDSCHSNQEGSDIIPDIMSIRYSSSNMQYIYSCCHCKTKWSN